MQNIDKIFFENVRQMHKNAEKIDSSFDGESYEITLHEGFITDQSISIPTNDYESFFENISKDDRLTIHVRFRCPIEIKYTIHFDLIDKDHSNSTFKFNHKAIIHDIKILGVSYCSNDQVGKEELQDFLKHTQQGFIDMLKTEENITQFVNYYDDFQYTK